VSHVTLCGKVFRKVLRAGAFKAEYQTKCNRVAAHSGKCDDMPFLEALRTSSDIGLKAANKVERDSMLTKGISWDTVKDKADATKKRPNRCLRWEFPKEHKDFDIFYCDYGTCFEVAKALALMAYRMEGSPPADEEAKNWLRELNQPSGKYVCPVCLEMIPFELFAKAKRSKAEIDTAHYPVPQVSVKRGKHRADNVAFVHHSCNVAQGNRTEEEFVQWMIKCVEKRGYKVVRV
jgi:hypothetical protein